MTDLCASERRGGESRTIASPTRYPSRLPAGCEEHFIPRDEPTVWSARGNTGAKGSRAGGAHDEAVLDADALGRFARSGHLCLPSFFEASEVRALRAELDAQLAWAAEHADDPRLVREPDGDVLRSIFAVHETSTRFARLARDRRLLTITRQLLDDDVYLHQTRLNLKPGFDGKPFWWHSDFETWHHEDGMPSMRCFSCVIALSEITPHNGPVLFLPGSHETFVGCVGETPNDNHRTSLRAQTVGVPSRDAVRALAEKHGLVAPIGPAGTVLLFDCNLMHGSNGNLTPAARHHLFFVYNAMSNRVLAPPSGRPPRPTYVATRDAVALRPVDPDGVGRPATETRETGPSSPAS